MSEHAPLALFVSYPFCKRKCAFCPRPVYSAPAPTRRRYLDALIKELEASSKAAAGQEVCAVRFGGGQPCQASVEELSNVLGCVRSNFSLSPHVEITLKAQPEPAENSAAGWLDAGFNRIDCPIVTTDPFARKLLGLPQLRGALGRFGFGGCENTGAELCFGLPGQTAGDLKEALFEILSLGAKHITLRPFSLSRDTPLGEFYGKHPDRFLNCPKRNIPSKEQAEELQNGAKAVLQSAKMQEYLPLRFAFPGWECRFERARAFGGDILGFGCFARSRFRGMRFGNTEFLDAYIANSPDFDKITAKLSIFG